MQNTPQIPPVGGQPSSAALADAISAQFGGQHNIAGPKPGAGLKAMGDALGGGQQQNPFLQAMQQQQQFQMPERSPQSLLQTGQPQGDSPQQQQRAMALVQALQRLQQPQQLLG